MTSRTSSSWTVAATSTRPVRIQRGRSWRSPGARATTWRPSSKKETCNERPRQRSEPAGADHTWRGGDGCGIARRERCGGAGTGWRLSHRGGVRDARRAERDDRSSRRAFARGASREGRDVHRQPVGRSGGAEGCNQPRAREGGDGDGQAVGQRVGAEGSNRLAGRTETRGPYLSGRECYAVHEGVA